ncbi:unnamed protein product [Brassicogethes aeneus]|uniref:Protein CASC3 n=1 Tax=Brassicogethes aeneus TaxID=1431903 RepID=A0A9P0AYN8_BRAAE|nr:unnamed protein product [Brassicogethes aeneus]
MGDAAVDIPKTISNKVEAPQEKAKIEAEVVENKATPENSEYDSAGSYSDAEPGEVRSRGTEDTGSESEGSVILEREEGDGQESAPSKKVDDDEDKKNPQYIPKRGTFYEHDDRTADDIEKSEAAAEAEKVDKDGKKKVWQDKKEKWSHDKFNNDDQAPKSRSELIAIYGYDIRNEEGAPRARRRRRYGRGPNKYTRNWEDEDAYNKPAPPRLPITKKPIRPRKSSEEFPPLGGNPRNNNNRNSESAERESVEEDRGHTPEKVSESNGNSNTPVQQNTLDYSRSTSSQESHKNNPRVGSGRVIKPKKEIQDSDYKGFTTRTRQVRNVKVDQAEPARNQKKDEYIHSQNFTNKNSSSVQALEKDMDKLNVQDGIYRGGKQQNNQRQGSVPPRLQSEQKGGSKRYSSMRQRSLPECATPPNYPTTFYPNDGYQQSSRQGGQAQIIHNPGQIHPATTQVPPMQQPALTMAQQVPVTAAPLLQPQFPSPFPPAPPPFLPAGVAPPQFIPQQTPQIINYVQGQPGYPPPNFQGYQQQFTPVVNTPPTELYQPQGGITYYSADQQIAQRPVPQKRPKAAIPIVAPPENDTKLRSKKDDENIYETNENVETINYEEALVEQ